MTDREALLCAVCESPDDDLPRLVMADFLEERGEAERAAFIRVQCELASLGDTCDREDEPHKCNPFEFRGKCLPCQKRYPLRRRERELLGPMVGGTNMRETEAKWLEGSPLLDGREIAGGGWMRAVEAEWCRGFIDSLTLSWADFIRVERSLIWSPAMTDECPDCRAKPGWRTNWTGPIKKWKPDVPCERCCPEDAPDRLIRGGTGRVPRPFAATAQPVRRVRLTTWPEGHPDGQTGPISSARAFFLTYHGHRFDRVKCPTCDGKSRQTGYCPTCERTPLSEWHCAAWPVVTFEMPEIPEIPTAGWTWQVEEQRFLSGYGVGLRTVHLEWFHPWQGATPQPGIAFHIDQLDIAVDAYLASTEWEMRGRERWLHLRAVSSGVPTLRG